MTNAELIEALRYFAEQPNPQRGHKYLYHHRWNVLNKDCYKTLIADAADAIEADGKRIADLETALAACRARRSEPITKEGEWQDEQRGRWIYAKCNLCGKVQDVRSNYCPNCGARMDGKEKTDE